MSKLTSTLLALALAESAYAADLYSWGYTGWGQLGDGAAGNGTNDYKTSPAMISTGWTFIAAGSDSSYALNSSGWLYAWGKNDQGQLGDGTTTNQSSPKRIGSATDWVAVSCKTIRALALKSSGELYTWGAAWPGGTASSSPRLISAGWAGASIATGTSHGMILMPDHKLYAFGYNAFGQLGDETSVDRSAPTLLPETWSAVACGLNFTLALHTSGDLYAWGNNDHRGQLGDGSYGRSASNTNKRVKITESTRSPVDMTNMISIACGFDHSLALKSTGELFTWGSNAWGETGKGDILPLNRPTPISGGWSSIACGDRFSLGIAANKDLYAWGVNSLGQLGDGTATYKSAPVFISPNWLSVCGGGSHALGLR